MSKSKFKKSLEETYNSLVEDVVTFIYNSDVKYNSKDDMLEAVRNFLELDKKTKNSPKVKKDHLWITLDEYLEKLEKGELICAYTSVRGAYKERPCGNPMTEDDLKLVNGDKTALRCHFCHSNNPPKPKSGCIRKLLEQRNGKTVQPNKVPGVNIPDAQGIKDLMGFMSGNDSGPTIEEVTGNAKIVFEDLDGDFKINFDKGFVCKNNIICGKLKDFTKDSKFDKSKFLELTEDEIKECKDSNYNYKFYQETDDDGDDDEDEETILNDLGNVN